jgi:hypothetical protein
MFELIGKELIMVDLQDVIVSSDRTKSFLSTTTKSNKACKEAKHLSKRCLSRTSRNILLCS